ncbi:MAG TPA: HAD-IA family hydrolase [Burkholderiales bacterium]|nr:HAD-IA family hydrolase [Burkholderiales bacterium]
MPKRYAAVLFDLLTGLIDSWTVWNRVAGGEENGRRWRHEYLKLTYGCGEYQPYESLVRVAATRARLPESLANRLQDSWEALEPWDDARGVLERLAKDYRLGVVTNCSQRLGRAAARRMGVAFDVVVTAERAGYYKPHPKPYQLALHELDLGPESVLFVAGSAFDLVGTAAVKLDTYWHNRVGLERPDEAPPPLREARTLKELFAGI